MPVIGIDASRAARGRRTGTETYSLKLIGALAGLASPQYRLRLYTPQPPQPADWPDGPNVETRLIPWPRLWTHLRLAAELALHPPDVLFVPAHVLPLYCPVPAAVTVHDLGYLYYPDAHTPFARWYLHWSTRRHCRTARHIFADSHATRQDLVRHYQADPSRISVVYLGRDESLAPVTDPAELARVRARYNLPDTYLLYLGTLQPRKNLIRLVEAFHLAGRQEALHGVHLVIAGKKGWLYEDIFRRVNELGLVDRVHFPGYIADQDKPALLSAALGFVFPSLYEGFGLPVLEAMACGTPVLTAFASSLPEVAGEAALLVDPHSLEDIAAGIVRLASDAGFRRRLVERGFLQVQKFSWEQTAQKVWEILLSLIK